MVGTITNAALAHGWEKHSDSRFYTAAGPSTGEALLAQEFLRSLKDYIDPHLRIRESREGNYEDLYAAALQIVQDETFEIVNPLISTSLSEIMCNSEKLWRQQPAHIDDNAFASLADRATELIQWTVFHLLDPVRVPVGMDALASVAGIVDQCDVFTLNHDLLIERLFDQFGVDYADGFGQKDGDVQTFNWSWNAPAANIRLFKLHGSIDWYRYRYPQYVQYAKVRSDPEHRKNSVGDRLTLLDTKPLFLTGTTVKEQSYGYSLVGELFAEFRSRLRHHHTLICCGYGWSDKGINIRLRQWLYDAHDNRLIILHRGSLDELKNKRCWYWYWDELEKAGKLVVVPKWLCDCSMQDLQPFFSN